VLLAQNLFQSTIFLTKYTLYIITYRICSCCTPSDRTIFACYREQGEVSNITRRFSESSVNNQRRTKFLSYERMNTKKHQADTFQPVNYVTLEAHVQSIIIRWGKVTIIRKRIRKISFFIFISLQKIFMTITNTHTHTHTHTRTRTHTHTHIYIHTHTHTHKTLFDERNHCSGLNHCPVQHPKCYKGMT
jgi:hypothetical protein